MNITLLPSHSGFSLVCTGLAWASLSLHLQVAAASDAFRTVALSRSQVPGAADGVTYANFRRHNVGGQLVTPVINNHGQVAFTGKITGTGVIFKNSVAIFSEGGGNDLTMIQRTNEVVPGAGGNVKFSSLSALPRIDDAGEIYFTARFDEINNSNLGAFRHTKGKTFRLDSREELFPSALSGQYYNIPSGPKLSDAGRAAFQASLFDPNAARRDHAIFREKAGGGFDRVAWFGQAAPGLPIGVKFGSIEQDLGIPNQVFSLRGLIDSGQSQIAFAAQLQGSGVSDRNDLALYRAGEENNQLILIAREGDPAPESVAGVTLHNMSSPIANLNGTSAFQAFLKDPTNSIVGAGVYAGNGEGDLRRVAVADELAPGVLGDYAFRRFGIMRPCRLTPGEEWHAEGDEGVE